MPETVQTPTEKWAGKVREVTLGASKSEGGTRSHSITVGGESTLPFLHFDGETPHRPMVAIEIYDVAPSDWSPVLMDVWGGVANDVVAWAKKAVEAGANLIALTLRGAHPEVAGRSPEDSARVVKDVLAAVGVPLVVYGPGVPETDNEVLVAVAEATSGERLALGLCEQNNYRTITAACMGSGHIAIARAPIDVNIQKQLNILISDMGLPLDRVLMDPTTGALGYGLEYTYSVMERLRLASLQGDSMTQQPSICTVGHEAWRAKESKVGEGVPAAWGDIEKRGLAWETLTATALLEAGADILVMRHPEAVAVVKKTIDRLVAK